MLIEFAPETDALREPEPFMRTARMLLEALAYVNGLHLERHPETPLLYESGVRYARQPGRERFRDIPSILARGTADCDQLCAWYVAAARRAGYDARFHIELFKDGADLRVFHVTVRMPDGRIEDPSRVLGMR